MEKIVFRNNLPPALNETTLNELQENIEDAIDEKVSSDDLADVAFSGNYNDLNNIPPGASVNDGKLTIKINGTTAQEFTANSSQDKEIDIKLSSLAVVLYNASDGKGTAGNVTLSQSAGNFNYLVVYYGNNNGDNRKSETIYAPNGKQATLTMNTYYQESSSNFYQYYYSKNISISGTTITDVKDWELRILNRGINNVTQDQRIYIHRVEGYK